jgi:curved DNA-binding protein CbpA
MPEVFISHSSCNRERASALRTELAAHGISCWMAPDDISIGQTWEDAITEAISTASVFVILWSRYSQSSLQVKRELSLAASQEKLIIPLRLDDEEPRGAFAYYLTNTHWTQLNSSTIGQCCISIKEQILSLEPRPPVRLRHPDSEVINSYSPKSEAYNVESCSGNLGLDVTHVIYISNQQSKQGHTRILKVGIGETAESLEVKVPAGIRPGARLRLKGKGNRSETSGLRGDLYLLVRIIDT